MSIKPSLKAAIAIAGITLNSVADQTISADTTLTANVSGKLTVENGASVHIGENITVGSYAINSGSIVVNGGTTLTVPDNNYTINVIGKGSGNVGVLTVNGTLVDTKNGNSYNGDTANDNSSYMLAGYDGANAIVNLNSNSKIDLDWKYLYACCKNNGQQAKTTINIDGGEFVLGEIRAFHNYTNTSDDSNPLNWPEALTVNISNGGMLFVRSINGSDGSKALVKVNLNGGKLKSRWKGNMVNTCAVVLNFASGISELTTEFHGGDGTGVTINGSNTYLTGSGAMKKTGSELVTIATECDTTSFTGDIYIEGGTLNFPIVADGINRTVYFDGGTLAVPAGIMVGTTRNGGTITFRSSNGNDIKVSCDSPDNLGDVAINVGTGRLFVNGMLVKVGSDKKYVLDGATSKIDVREGSLAVSNPLFYRWVVDAKYGGGDSHMQIQEMLFTTDDGWRTGSQLGATASCYNNEDFSENEGASKAIDGSINPDGSNFNIGGKFLDWVHSISDGKCYLQLLFSAPVKLNAYSWMTANDELDIASGNCRTPSAWHWMVSPDGSQWKEITRVTSSDNGIDTDNIVQAFAQAGYWQFPSTDMGDILSGSTVALQAGSGLYLENGIAATIGGLANQGGAVNLSDGTTLRSAPESGATALLAGGGITGLGGVVKKGSGTTLASGVNTYTGDTVVSEGTYRIFAGVANPRFFKFSFMNREGGCVQFTRLKLVAEDGSVPSYGLTARNQGTAASDLAENEFAPCDGMGWGASSLGNIFVDNDEKFCSNEDSNFRSIVMRLSNASSRIVGINIMSGNDDVSWNNRYLRSWKLEASTDGMAWTEVASQAETTRTEANLTWYYESDVPVFVELPGTGVTATTIPSSSTLEVKPGATLVVNTEMTISKLRINLDDEKAVVRDGNATPGKIEGFTPAQNGILELTCNDAEIQSKIAAHQDIAIGLDFESVSGTANDSLKSWSCTLNGQKMHYRLEINEGARNSKLKFSGGVFFMVY